MHKVLILILLVSLGFANESIEIPDSLYSERITREGETLGIRMVKRYEDLAYIYQEADGSMVIYDFAKSSVEKHSLPQIGRNGYLGDDFVFWKGDFYFLNTVDRKIEIVDGSTFKLKEPYNIPENLFAEFPRLTQRMAKSIDLSPAGILLSNGITQELVISSVSLGNEPSPSIVEKSKKWNITWTKNKIQFGEE